MNSRLAIQPAHLAPNGYLHAATIVELADTTCGYATMAHLPDGALSFTTIELQLSVQLAEPAASSRQAEGLSPVQRLKARRKPRTSL